MVAITLTPEQIRGAPLEVRRWLEREIAAALDLPPRAAAAEERDAHLVACGRDEAAALYAAVRGVLPVVTVLFELGREGESVGRGEVESYRLGDMLRHARLQSLEQLEACLQVLDEVLRRLRGDPDATLYLLDGRGACLVAALTQKSILGVWRQVIAGQDPVAAEVACDGRSASGDGPPHAFASISAPIPGAAMPLGDAFPAPGARAEPRPAGVDGAAHQY